MTRYVLAVAFAVTLSLGSSVRAGDVVDIDLTNVDPSAQGLVTQAEQFWEAQLAGYSSELPLRMRRQITALQLTAFIQPVDGVGGTLGFAGPTETFSIRPVGIGGRGFEVVTRAMMVFDLDDFPSLEADGTLLDVIIHEMGHAFGIGTIWQGNDTLEVVPSGPGPFPNYIGRYGLQEYQAESGFFSATTVPIEQNGGPGTAGGHWTDGGFFNNLGEFNARKAYMTGFLCDLFEGQVVCLPKFLSGATRGSLADMGFAVVGVNEQFVVPRNAMPLPEFDKGQIAPTVLAGGIAVSFGGPMVSIRTRLGDNGAGVANNDDDESVVDPYNLRRGRWAR